MKAVRISLVIATEMEDSSDVSLHGGMTVEIWSNNDINIQEARRELSDKLINWARGFLGYDETTKIVIRSIASNSDE